MGGLIAMEMAIHFPACVHRLVLVDALGLGKEMKLKGRVASIPALGELLASRMYTPDVKKYGKSVKSDCVNKIYITNELVEALYNLEQNPTQYKTTLKVLRKYMNWMGQKSSTYGPIIDRLSSITSPTLVIWGRQDDSLPLKQGELAVKSLPNAHLETIDNCGHISMFDQPEIFNKLLLEFLRD